MKFKGDIIITDPSYVIKPEDVYKNIKSLGFTKHLISKTIYGDWSCTTYNSDTEEVLGHFCADAALVSVFLLDEVLRYSPTFDYHLNRTWTTTLIKDFDGVIEIVVEDSTFEDSEGEICEDKLVRVVGKGNINFHTEQTGV